MILGKRGSKVSAIAARLILVVCVCERFDPQCRMLPEGVGRKVRQLVVESRARLRALAIWIR